MDAHRRRGLSMTLLGLVLLMAAFLIHFAVSQFRPPVPSVSTPPPTAMSRRIRSALQRFGPSGTTQQLYVGQQVNTVGGFSTRYATYADVIQLQGRVVLWGTGYVSWSYPGNPDINFTARPATGDQGALYPISRPANLTGNHLPSPHAHWVAANLPGFRLVIAQAQHGVWAWEERQGHYSQVLGPFTFHNG